ncbi:MAG: hydrogenase formation protein HypD [Candidatus Methanoplasma sp.]|jgi:hydrogenase expression/formation protein HypD|nr:hydrogenase formation protein HypD [Candidatus Methanoplasma sp.]
MFKYRDGETAKKIVASIKDMGLRSKFMHVCGTHQDTIVRFGLEEMLLDAGIEICQGPGCPVCVTTSKEIADAVTLARNGVTVTAFGDMMRVPTTIGSLFDAKADGADVRIVYSIEDAVRMAGGQTSPLVFVSVGFETTAPSTCVPLQKPLPKNFSIYSCHRICPPALQAIFDMGETKVNGFIMPGHVAVITGLDMFRPFADKYRMPQVVAGFEPLDILMASYMLTKQIYEGRAEVENEYSRLVKEHGNPIARKLMEDTFIPVDREWRGFPVIPKSALALRPEHSEHDATIVHGDILKTTPEVEAEAAGCRCGEVLRGLISSEECPMFGAVCRPSNPRGPCMVSEEGSCSIAYRFSAKKVRK